MVQPGSTLGPYEVLVGVSHPDGRQLQRIGVLPDLAVHPTIAGIRAGRDEVLERAVRHLEEVTEKH